MLNRFAKALMAVGPLFLLFSCSCGTIGSQASKNSLTIPRSSFLKIDVIMAKRNCNPETKICEIERADFISGSGFVIDRAPQGGTYVMTAAHVCEPKHILDLFFRNQKYILEFVGVTKEKDKFSMHVLELDHKNDLCLLYAKTLERTPIPVAEKRLLPGDKIYNIAAPRGVLYRGAPIIVDGIFNGNNQDSGHDMYTMLVAGGSSGSAIMNEKGEIVGMVSMMDLRFPFIVYSPSHANLREFANRAIIYHSLHAVPSYPEISSCLQGDLGSCGELLQ